MSVHKAKLQQGLSVPLDRGYKRAFNEGKASRDAEVAGLKALAGKTDQPYSTLVAQMKEIDALRAQVAEKDRLLKVALEAMERAHYLSMEADVCRVLEDAIKAIKEAK